MRTIVLFIIFALTLPQVYAQFNTYKPQVKDIRFTFAPTTAAIAKMPDRLARLNAFKVSELDSVDTWRYYLYKSSLHLYLEKDSAVEYLRKSMEIYPNKTCGLLVRIDQGMKWKIEHNRIPKDSSWYIKDLPNFDEEAFISTCLEKHVSRNRKKKVKVVDSTALGRQLRYNDKKYRKVEPIDWDKQNILDQRNRFILDSVFEERGSLKHFTQFELNAFMFVVHHSVDIDWTMKWFDIFYSAMETEEIKGASLIGPAMDRFFHPKTGYIVEKEPKKARAFMNMLKQKYPKTIKRFEFEDY